MTPRRISTSTPTVGVDVGGTSVRAGVVDVNGEVLDTARAPTPRTDDALEEAIASAVDELRTRHRVGAVGLALAGFIDAPRGLVRYAPHLSWRDAPVAERISARLGLPVVVEHDANAAALAERRHGAAAGSSVCVLIALGTGIGGALLLDGALFRGAHGVAPELGHLRVVPEGRSCPCGKRGCWERYCSGTALAATALEMVSAGSTSSVLARESSQDPGRITGQRVAAAAREGDALARRAVHDMGRWLGEGLALVADVFDPDLVIVGGGVSASAPLFLDEAREHYARVVTGSGNRPLARIRTAQLGAASAVVGAATLARESIPA
ncbi:MAG: ROK family glucokinase [Pseudonocardia sp.]|nr:ROK family glucokinase [Pseudonocardia sp.]